MNSFRNSFKSNKIMRTMGSLLLAFLIVTVSSVMVCNAYAQEMGGSGAYRVSVLAAGEDDGIFGFSAEADDSAVPQEGDEIATEDEDNTVPEDAVCRIRHNDEWTYYTDLAVAFNQAKDLTGDIIIETLRTSDPSYTLQSTITFNKAANITLRTTQDEAMNPDGFTSTIMRGFQDDDDDTSGLIKLTGTNTKLITEHITFDGSQGNDGAKYTGRAFYVNGGALSIEDGTTIRHFKTTNTADNASYGGGAIYQCKGAVQINSNDQNSVILFEDCSGKYGGAIWGAGVKVTGNGSVIFDSCTATKNGGSIYSTSDVSLKGTAAHPVTFTRCKSMIAGGGFYQSSGATTTLENVVFGASMTDGAGNEISDPSMICWVDHAKLAEGESGKRSAYGGAFASASNKVTIVDSAFYGSKAVGDVDRAGGGAIYLSGQADTEIRTTGYGSVRFLSCTAPKCGALSANGNVSLINGEHGSIVFDSCTATRTQSGGFAAGKSVTIENKGNGTVRFTNCSHTSGNGEGGGAFYSGGAVTITNAGTVEFESCTSKLNGGAFYSSGDVTITNTGICRFHDCHAAYEYNFQRDGGAIWCGGSVRITGSAEHPVVFTKCSASQKGGAIMQYGGTVTELSHVIFGAIGEGQVSADADLACSAGYSAGAMLTKASESVHISNCTFYGCAQTNGNLGSRAGAAALYIGDTALTGDTQIVSTAKVKLEDNTFIGCMSKRYSGAVYMALEQAEGSETGHTANINRCTFADCETTHGAGALYIYSGDVQIDDCSFTGCKGEQGGAVNLYGGKAVLKDSIISGCSGTKKGDAVFVGAGASFQIQDSTITGNTGSHGAVAVQDNTSRILLEGKVVIEKNGAEGDYKNIYLDVNSDEVIQVTGELDSKSSIGVYATNDANAYKNHGKSGQTFATKPDTMQEGMFVFFNDIDPVLRGRAVASDPEKVYWTIYVARVSNTKDAQGDPTDWTYHEYLINSALKEGSTTVREGVFDQANTLTGDVIIETLRKGPVAGQGDDTLIEGVSRYTLTSGFTFDKSGSVTLRTTQDDTLNPDGFTSTIMRGFEDGGSYLGGLIKLTGTNTKFITEHIIFDGSQSNDGKKYTGRAFYVNGGTLSIEDGTTMRHFKTTNTNGGGAIYQPAGSVQIINKDQNSVILFEDCNNGNEEGGAIRGLTTINVSNAGTLTFRGCIAGTGGSIETEAPGAHIFINNTGTITIDKCTGGRWVGGAICAYKGTSNISITGSGTTEFKNCNSGSKEGGAIYAEGSVTLEHVTFSNCFGSSGGAIYAAKTADLTNVTFGEPELNDDGTIKTDSDGYPVIKEDTGCTASNSGGALYAGGNISLTDCNFSYCKVDKGNGGAIFGEGDIRIYGTVFDHCEAKEGNDSTKGLGGAVCLRENKDLVIDKSDSRRSAFIDCKANRYGGAVIYDQNDNNKTSSFSHTDFIRCEATNNTGGAIFTDAKNVLIEDCTFIDCKTANSDRGGGALMLNEEGGGDTAIEIKNSSFTSCEAPNGNGGSIYLYRNRELRLKNVSIDGGKAEQGAAVYSAGNLTVKQTGDGKSEIKNCEASDPTGGAVNVASGKSVTFEGKVVVYDNKDATGNQKNVILDQNSSGKILTSSVGLSEGAHIGIYVTGQMNPETEPYKTRGGVADVFGTYVSDANLDAFTNDRNAMVGEKGTGTDIRWRGYLCKLTDSDGKLLYTADHKPAVYETLTAAFADCAVDLYKNDGTKYAKTNDINLEMLRDYTQPAGDAVTSNANRQITITTASTNAVDNYSYIPGADAARATITRGYTGNSLITFSGKGLIVKDIIFDGNSSTYKCEDYGGIINISSSAALEVIYTLIKDSLAVTDGGAIYSSSNKTITITDSSFQNCDTEVTNNSVTRRGGAVCATMTAGAINLTASSGGTVEFKDCSSRAGGAIWVEGDVSIGDQGGTVLFDGCESTNSDGGAIYSSNKVGIDNTHAGTVRFTDCKCETRASSGGAIFARKGFTCNSSGTTEFDNCIASNHGGGVYVYDGSVSISGTTAHPVTFTRCKVLWNQNQGWGAGGAIGQFASTASMQLTNVNFGALKSDGSVDNEMACTAHTLGGAVFTYSPVTLTDCNIYGGKVDLKTAGNGNRVGGGVYSSKTIEIISTEGGLSSFIGCQAEMGGAIFSGNSDPKYGSASAGVTIRGNGQVTFKDCLAQGSAHPTMGGAVYSANDITISGNAARRVSFVNCNALANSTTQGSGGAICIVNGMLVTDQSLYITGCQARMGSAIYLGKSTVSGADNYSSLTMTGGEITGNTTTMSGDTGAIEVAGTDNRINLQGAVKIAGNHKPGNKESNILLNQDSAEIIQVIGDGLTDGAAVGVWATYENHYEKGKPFATVTAAGANEQLSAFVNDWYLAKGETINGEAQAAGTGGNVIWANDEIPAPTGVNLRFVPWIIIALGGALLMITRRRRTTR